MSVLWTFQQEFHSFGEVAQTFRFGLALTVRSRNFEACRPKTAFTGFALMNNGCELFHKDIYTLFWKSCKIKKAGLSPRLREIFYPRNYFAGEFVSAGGV
jgi:hypothetical protein